MSCNIAVLPVLDSESLHTTDLLRWSCDNGRTFEFDPGIIVKISSNNCTTAGDIPRITKKIFPRNMSVQLVPACELAHFGLTVCFQRKYPPKYISIKHCLNIWMML